MSPRDFVMPASRGLADRCSAWVADPGVSPPTKPAATVILVRDGVDGVEVFVQRRVSTMAFAPRMTVFPGGSVDATDYQPLPWAGPSPTEWASVLAPAPGGELDQAGDRHEGDPAGDEAEVSAFATAAAVVTAAIRELFEEAGVLLAGVRGHTAIEATNTADLVRARGQLLTRERSLAQVLTEHELVARTDLLGFHAHWITPEVEPRRYDTYFFSALVPPGQAADAETTEAEIADWVLACDILQEGTDSLMPPTRVCLEAIAAAPSAAAFVAARQPVPTVMPVPVLTDRGWAMRADLP